MSPYTPVALPRQVRYDVVVRDNIVSRDNTEGATLDDAIDEALAAVAQQTAGYFGNEDQPGSSSTPDTLPAYDPTEVGMEGEATDDSLAAETDEVAAEAETEAEETFTVPPWEDPASPYYPQYLAYQRAEQDRQQLAQQQAQTRQMVTAIQAAKSEADANALFQQLQELDPQVAQQYHGQRVGLIQQARNAQAEMTRWQHSMAALHLAMADEVDPETLARIVARGEELVRQPGLDQMQGAVTSRRQVRQESSQREAALAQQIKDLQLQIAANKRITSGVDRVDTTQAKTPRAKSPADAENMDDFFEAWQGDLNRMFG